MQKAIGMNPEIVEREIGFKKPSDALDLDSLHRKIHAHHTG